MATKILPNFATLSEFIAGLNGDCGPTATLSALNHVDPSRWPLTAAGLKALDADEIAHGFAEANRAQNIDSMSNYLTHVGVKHTTVSYGTYSFTDLHQSLQRYSGVYPIIVEWSLAGRLPGDEPAVHFHFSTDGGVNTGKLGDGVGGGYYWCDGDNSADDGSGKPRPPILYTIQQIEAAAPIAYIIVTEPPVGVPTPPPTDWEAEYKKLKAAVLAAVNDN